MEVRAFGQSTLSAVVTSGPPPAQAGTVEDRPRARRGGSRPLVGRVALVTGGSRGIGRGIAIELGAAGADVVVHYRRNREAASGAVAAIRSSGGRAVAVQASMGEPQEVDAMADAALEAFGFVDILVSNAGDAGRRMPVADTYPAELRRQMTAEPFSAARLAQRLLPQMRERPRGDIIVISSSELAHMRPGLAAYNMAKAALEALALTLAKEEIVHGVRVNIVAPGLVATDMGARWARAELGPGDAPALEEVQALRRALRPEDVARVVSHLVSDAAGFVNGRRLVVDGVGTMLEGAPS